MRAQSRAITAIPIPGDVPYEQLLDYIQTFEPILRHNPGMLNYSEVPFEPEQIADDPFFEPRSRDKPIRCFKGHEVIWLGPGLTKPIKWPIFFQRAETGIRCRCNASAGVISWTEWHVRPLQPAMSPPGSVSSSGSPSVPSSNGEEWELYGTVIVEANRMLLPFCSINSEGYLNAIGQSMIDEIRGKQLAGAF
ncbi:hypothetical protein EDB81DRAFT_808845 [Dactylonectria macrodidyma]|uniref:DUF7053 domain-containing protein n=1 Tax=Dactylonectria macrodidyma TaxID=307937 RepID=A0A9P9DZ78_9HYPO|nr:hypothetical protein EDB81DRAFT_808845 [Dactylonectria macrodidyma]